MPFPAISIRLYCAQINTNSAHERWYFCKIDASNQFCGRWFSRFSWAMESKRASERNGKHIQKFPRLRIQKKMLVLTLLQMMKRNAFKKKAQQKKEKTGSVVGRPVQQLIARQWNGYIHCCALAFLTFRNYFYLIIIFGVLNWLCD